jgi:peptide/nickel transport system substrate-binding protein
MDQHSPAREPFRQPAPISRRRFLRNGLAGAGAVALAPIVGRPRLLDAAGRDAVTRGGTLTFGRNTGPTQFDPANSIVGGDVYTLDKIFEPLYVTSPAGKLTPWLATGHNVSPDGLTWTFKLRSGVKFSDGKPLAPEDVVFSILRAAHDKTGPLSFLDTAIKDISAKGTSAVVFQLTETWAPFLSDISCFCNSIVPANYGGESAASFFTHPVGTGPFLLQSFVKGAGVTLVRNPHYWQVGKPYLDIDVCATAPPADVASLRSDPSVEVKLFPSWALTLLFFNEKVPQFKDRNVRRAIAHAIDVPALTKATTFATAQPGGSFFPPSLEYYAKVPTLPYSKSAAKASLAKSAYPKGFSTELLISSGNQTWAEDAQIIQQELKAIGIEVAIKSLDNAAYTAAFTAFNYQMMINGATNDISDPDEMASFQVDVQNGGSHSFWTYYDDPKAIALVREAERTFSGSKRAALYREIQEVVAQDAPYIPLYYTPNIYAWSPKVHGFAVNPGGAYRLEDVWVG